MSDGEFEISTKSFISRMADTSDGPTTDVTKRALGFLKGRAHKVSGLSGDLVTLGKVARRNTDAPF